MGVHRPSHHGHSFTLNLGDQLIPCQNRAPLGDKSFKQLKLRMGYGHLLLGAMDRVAFQVQGQLPRMDHMGRLVGLL